MNIFINVLYLDDVVNDAREKRFPLIYFWLKDYYYQMETERFKETNWSYSDEPTPISQDKDIQEKFKASPPDIVGLSLYLWNEDLLLENARWIKENYPDTLIVAAGPNADASVKWLTDNHFIDIVILGPGAEIFRRVIDAKFNGEDYKKVDGVHYLDGDRVVRNKPVPRKQDPLVLDFVTNFYDEVKYLLDQYTEKHSSVIFPTILVQGCPYSCSFCEQGTSLWTKITRRDVEKNYREIDFIKNYSNVVYEFADANVGIVPEYEQLLDYIIENNQKGNLSIKRPAMAKQNVEYNFQLLEKMYTNKLIPRKISYIALQDTNPDVLKLNGRPISLEYEKIEKFREVTEDMEHKFGTRVDIILGMPGQSFDTLSKTLSDLAENELLSNDTPKIYVIFPNTTLTSGESKIYYKANKVYIRGFLSYNSGYLDLPDHNENVILNFLTETETISSEELITSYYMFILLGHMYGFLGWLRTPLNYLKNYHGVSLRQFVKKFTESFHPNNRHVLPKCIQEDLESIHRWFIGKDKFLQRKDIHDQNFLTPMKMSIYRFHASYDEVSEFYKNIFAELIGYDDKMLDDLMKWQGAKTLKFSKDSKYKHEILSYNYDDIALAKEEKYYKSKFKFDFGELNNFDILYNKLINIEDISFIPTTLFEEIDPSEQVELNKKDIK